MATQKEEIKTEEKKYKFTQGQRVYFNMGPKAPTGWGKVCGAQGPIVIVELEQPIKNYPFTHAYVVDTCISEPTEIPFRK